MLVVTCLLYDRIFNIYAIMQLNEHYFNYKCGIDNPSFFEYQ